MTVRAWLDGDGTAFDADRRRDARRHPLAWWLATRRVRRDLRWFQRQQAAKYR